MKKILILLGILIIISCSKEKRLLTDCPDSRLIGEWVYDWDTSWYYGIYEISDYKHYTFEDNNKCSYYGCHWSYLPNEGWHNATKKGHLYDYQWSRIGDIFKEKLWNNEFSDWRSYGFKYIDKTHIIIGGKIFVKQ